MSIERELDLDKWRQEKSARILRQAAKAYLFTALKLYIGIEAKVSIWSDERFGASADAVCSLNRAIEHLLKLRLFKIDPLLVYPMPRNVEDYCILRGIPIQGTHGQQQRREREILARSISFGEALTRVELTQRSTNFDFACFKEINALRNSLEHHWDRNEEFLQKIVGRMSPRVIPCLRAFITDILEENEDAFFDRRLLDEVGRLDRAIEQGHSLELQHRFETHHELFSADPERCRQEYHYPDRYRALAEEQTEARCPVCSQPLVALWEWEADYDVEGGEAYISGAFPDTKCLHCPNCHFYVEGWDIGAYLPEGLEVEPEPDWDEDAY